MTARRPNYVDLHRTFVLHYQSPGALETSGVPSQDQEDANDLDWDALFDGELVGEWGADVSALSGRFAWTDLLGERLAIILGEAGSGKTAELGHQARRLRSEGRYAFLLTVDSLVNIPIKGALDPSDTALFEAWLRGSDAAYFFLDSVDEAERLDPGALQSALHSYKQGIWQGFDRAHTIISCRASDWAESLAESALDRFLLTVTPEDQAQELAGTHRQAYKVFRISPLGPRQIAKLVSENGHVDSQPFLEALESADALGLASRPLDALALLACWRERGHFGTLRDLIEADIDRRLLESNPIRAKLADLSLAKARNGAEKLAAASILCQRDSFSVPDWPSSTGQSDGHLDPRRLLPEWQPGEVAELMRSGLFDPATYARIRFHHRTVQDYLAAKGLLSVARGENRRTVERLAFVEIYGLRVVSQALAPVVAWLASLDESFRRLALKIAPEILLRHGDPQLLPIADREALLHSMTQKLKGRSWADLRSDPSALRRLADPALADTILGLLEDRSQPGYIRELMLAIIGQGSLRACVGRILRIPLDDTEPMEIRQDAISALSKAATSEELGEFAPEVLARETIPRKLVVSFAELLYPRVIEPPGLGAILRHGRADPRREVGHVGYWATRVIKSAPVEHLGDIITELLKLAKTSPHIKSHDREVVSKDYSWTIEPLQTAVARVLEKVLERDWDQGILVDADTLLTSVPRHLNLGPHESPLADTLRRIPEARYLFAKAWMQIGGALDPIPDAWPLIHDSSERRWQLAEEDLDWLVSQASDSGSVGYRALALNAALLLWRRMGSPELRLPAIEAAAEGVPALEALIAKHTEPPSEEIHRQREEQRKQEEKWEHEQKDARDRDLAWLHQEADRLRMGEHMGSLAYLVRHGGKSSSFSDVAWDEIADEYGEDIKSAVRAGCKAVWRRQMPAIDELEDRGTRIEAATIVGLAGLAADVADGLELKNLPPEDVTRALRFAVLELNGLPGWFEVFAHGHRDQVRRELTDLVVADLSTPAEAATVGDTVTKVAHGPQALCDLVAPGVLSSLQFATPARLGGLHDALRVLSRSTVVPRGEFATLAARWAPHEKADRERLLLWVRAWLWADARPALDFLESLLSEPQEDGADLVMALVAKLAWPRDPWEKVPLADPSFLDFDSLVRLVLLLYRHVAPESDLRHEGMYSPAVRDDAQSVRDRFVRRLADVPGRKTFDTLQDLARQPVAKAHRDWLLDLADQRAARDAQLDAWDPSDVVRFFEGGAMPEEGLTLATVDVEGFRMVGNPTKVPLERHLTVFLGDNAAGKTTILDAIAAGLGALTMSLINEEGYPLIRTDLHRGKPARLAARTEVELKEAPAAAIRLGTREGLGWERVLRRDTELPAQEGNGVANGGQDALGPYVSELLGSIRRGEPTTIPVYAYYGASRFVAGAVKGSDLESPMPGHLGALHGSLEAGASFDDAFDWFKGQEDAELREGQKRRDFDYRLPALSAVRRALVNAIPGASEPRVEMQPPRLLVNLALEDGRREVLSLAELSDGYRAAIALVIDLARRMAQANPHLDDPLQAKAIVLIDEVDLHLHPRWQQTILADLPRAFPEAQFIVTTHSPHVVSTVRPECIRVLKMRETGFSVESVSSTYGAESGRILEEIFEVEQRPQGNEVTKKLAEYWDLVKRDEWDSAAAQQVRQRLEDLAGEDPELLRIDIEIRRRKALRKRAEKE